MYKLYSNVDFEWDPEKNEENIEKHRVSFEVARQAWLDPMRVTARDKKHSSRGEQRYFLYGSVGGDVMTVRFTRAAGVIRIIGAGYWREGRQEYEKRNQFRR